MTEEQTPATPATEKPADETTKTQTSPTTEDNK